MIPLALSSRISFRPSLGRSWPYFEVDASTGDRRGLLVLLVDGIEALGIPPARLTRSSAYPSAGGRRPLALRPRHCLV